MSISDHLENAFLNTLRNTSLAVANVYIQLHTGVPGEAGGNNIAGEATRKVVTFAAASGGSMSSSAPDVSWTSYPAPETISHISLWDASTAGNCLWTGVLSASKVMGTGDTLTIPSGQLTLTLD